MERTDNLMADLNSLGGIHYEMMKRCYNPKSVMWKWYGENANHILEGFFEKPVLAVRVNTVKTTPQQLMESLQTMPQTPLLPH